jgi:hypothetical protein
MRILFDNGTPRGIARELAGHSVVEAREQGWDRLQNGDLLEAAETAGFDLLITTDKNLRYQQNLEGRKIAIMVLGKGRWRLIKPVLPHIVDVVNAVTAGAYLEVDIPG